MSWRFLIRSRRGGEDELQLRRVVPGVVGARAGERKEEEEEEAAAMVGGKLAISWRLGVNNKL